MKKFVKNFNNLITKTIFKVQNKTNSNFQISNFNKYLIIFISLLFFYLFYLSIPALYDKSWVQSNIENKLLKEFRINLSASSDVSYRILPTPHFLLKDSKIFKKDDEKIGLISDIKIVKIFINQSNFFDKEKIKIKNIKINNANFSLLRSDFNSLNEFSNIKFSENKIEINDSNIFFKDSLGETISIIKIKKAFLFFDKTQLLNLFNLKAEVFNIPFIFDFKNKINSLKNKKINIYAKKLKLNILNESSKNNNGTINGINTLSTLKNSIKTKYQFENNIVTFESNNSKIYNSKVKYNGKLSINPFDLDFNINLPDFKISKIFNFNYILTDLIKTGIMFNNNISINTSIAISTKAREEIFQIADINFDIFNGKINLNKTKFINKKIGKVVIGNSNLFLKNDKLTLNTDVIIDINNVDNLFSLLQTKKVSRKLIKNILINLDYDFHTNQIEFNNMKIDNKEVNDELLVMLEGFNDNNLNNFNKSKRLLNLIFDAYEG